MPRKLVVIAGVVLVAVCCVAAAAIAGLQLAGYLPMLAFGPTATPTPVPVINREPVPTQPPAPTETSTSLPVDSAPTAAPPPATVEPSPQGTKTTEKSAGHASPARQLSTQELLTRAQLPVRDQRELSMRLRTGGQDIPQTVELTHTYRMGDVEPFWVTDNRSTPPRQFQVNATVQAITEHSIWWVQEGMSVDAARLNQSAERFETQTYPTNREFFGSEWSPGVDNDVHVHVFMGDVPGVAGYFSASNSYTTLAEPYSNQHEMFFVNLKSMQPGNDYFDSVLAHEFQHMIHWHQDRNEETWVNEGLSELATFLNGYGASNFAALFPQVPDTQLNNWPSSIGSSGANYGGSFMFMAYFLQRFGEEMTRAVVAAPENGIEGFNAVLEDFDRPERFGNIFADFVTANYLQNPRLIDGRWGYSQFTVPAAAPTERVGQYPFETETTVHQFGTDYFELTGSGDISIEFTGSTSVPVVNNQPHSGARQWYSHRGDDTNTRLTRTVDLRGIDSATLNYWTWFDIESDWDYGYVEVSTDGGQTWTILQTPHSASDNPSGNAFGPGYTGLSGGGDVPRWIEERLDLSDYAGQEIQIRFEYVTDDGVNRAGWTLDDISIPEIGFFDDAESDAGGWQAEGFVRMDNILPQTFLAQILQIRGSEVVVTPIPLDETNFGTVTIRELGSGVDKAVLLVSGQTEITTEPAGYRISVDSSR